MEMPKDVAALGHALSRDPSHELYQIAKKLISKTPDLMRLWQAVEKRKIGDDDIWVWSFLRTAYNASSLPPYHYMNAEKRRKLSSRICESAKTLCLALQESGLDGHLTYLDGINLNGFYLYEDFDQARQAEIRAAKDPKVKVSKIVERIAERAQEKIRDEPHPGKIGKKAKLIRFARLIADRNIRLYGKPFPREIAIAAHAIFRTEYSAKDVSMLLLRRPSQ